MKLSTRSEVIAALRVAPIGIREVESFGMLRILRNLTASGDATCVAGYYSLTWTVAK
jgi:hypothetical protein